MDRPQYEDTSEAQRKIPSLKFFCIKNIGISNPDEYRDIINNDISMEIHKEIILFQEYIQMILDIKKIVLDNDYTIYGGFVRDFIIGKIPFFDIDVFHYEHGKSTERFTECIEGFVSILKNKYKVEIIKKSEDFYPSVKIVVYHKEYKELYINMDITVGGSTKTDDFDINRFSLEKSHVRSKLGGNIHFNGKHESSCSLGYFKSYPGGMRNLVDINNISSEKNCSCIQSSIDRIKRKEFYLLLDDGNVAIYNKEFLSGCRSYNVKISDRISRMIDRGWKMLNVDYLFEDV